MLLAIRTVSAGLKGRFWGFALFALFSGVGFASDEGSYAQPTLTFHMAARNGDAVVLGGTLEGPKDSSAAHVELILQLYKSGTLVSTQTANIENLSWPKVSFRLPLTGEFDCYEVVALRAFDSKGNILPSADKTSEILKPGRCLQPDKG